MGVSEQLCGTQLSAGVYMAIYKQHFHGAQIYAKFQKIFPVLLNKKKRVTEYTWHWWLLNAFWFVTIVCSSTFFNKNILYCTVSINLGNGFCFGWGFLFWFGILVWFFGGGKEVNTMEKCIVLFHSIHIDIDAELNPNSGSFTGNRFSLSSFHLFCSCMEPKACVTLATFPGRL